MTRAVGRVVKAHGLGGELMVELSTDSPDVRFAPGAVLSARPREGASRSLTVIAARPHAGRLLVRFEGVDDRDHAEDLRGTILAADPADLPPNTDPDEFYDHELEGLAVVMVDGTRVGTLREITHGAGGDLLVVEWVGGGDVLVPFVQQIVPSVDVALGRIVIDPPEGLVE